jgi:hypothetical protein
MEGKSRDGKMEDAKLLHIRKQYRVLKFFSWWSSLCQYHYRYFISTMNVGDAIFAMDIM